MFLPKLYLDYKRKLNYQIRIPLEEVTDAINWCIWRKFEYIAKLAYQFYIHIIYNTIHAYPAFIFRAQSVIAIAIKSFIHILQKKKNLIYSFS